MAGLIFTLVFVGLGLAVAAFLVGHRLGKGVDITRKREVRAVRLQLAKLAGQLGRIETLALDNADGLVLSTQILKITRSTIVLSTEKD